VGVTVRNSDVRGTRDVKKGQDEQSQLHEYWTKDEGRALVRERLKRDSAFGVGWSHCFVDVLRSENSGSRSITYSMRQLKIMRIDPVLICDCAPREKEFGI